MEIKFRGKSKLGFWVFGSHIKYVDGDYIFENERATKDKNPLEHFALVAPETVGQWTGLLDKNGKEIYEGDIIKKRTSISLVSNDFFYDACDFLYKGFFLEKIKSAYGYCLEFDKTNPEYEIIGNKIDNPELLEGK